jgi:glucose/arabinose dehydrogenase
MNRQSSTRSAAFCGGGVPYLLLVVFSLLTVSSRAQVALQRVFPRISVTHPVDVQHAGDDRLFVVEQEGKIQAISPDGEHSSEFLDIRRLVRSGGELGLLGLAFHPRYATNGYFYVDYTADTPLRTIVARYRVNPSNANAADPSSARILLVVPQPFENHNGGQIAFGPDGYLYVALGDGGAAGDPFGNGQNRKTLLGKLLRIDVNTQTATTFYGIPPDNPFVGNSEGWRPEIYAYGLRNPWRFSFDRLTGALWAGDVGQNRVEEVDVITRGGNYGWNVMEGTLCYNPSSGCDTSGSIRPVIEYGRSEGVCVTGGYVYRGNDLPTLVGKYVFGDYGSGRIWCTSGPGDRQLLLKSGLAISTFGVDRGGELYVCDYAGGKIYRFVGDRSNPKR